MWKPIDTFPYESDDLYLVSCGDWIALAYCKEGMVFNAEDYGEITDAKWWMEIPEIPE